LWKFAVYLPFNWNKGAVFCAEDIADVPYRKQSLPLTEMIFIGF